MREIKISELKKVTQELRTANIKILLDLGNHLKKSRKDVLFDLRMYIQLVMDNTNLYPIDISNSLGLEKHYFLDFIEGGDHFQLMETFDVYIWLKINYLNFFKNKIPHEDKLEKVSESNSPHLGISKYFKHEKLIYQVTMYYPENETYGAWSETENPEHIIISIHDVSLYRTKEAVTEQPANTLKGLVDNANN